MWSSILQGHLLKYDTDPGQTQRRMTGSLEYEQTLKIFIKTSLVETRQNNYNLRIPVPSFLGQVLCFIYIPKKVILSFVLLLWYIKYIKSSDYGIINSWSILLPTLLPTTHYVYIIIQLCNTNIFYIIV